jgi:hypothetical protein
MRSNNNLHKSSANKKLLQNIWSGALLGISYIWSLLISIIRIPISTPFLQLCPNPSSKHFTITIPFNVCIVYCIEYISLFPLCLSFLKCIFCYAYTQRIVCICWQAVFTDHSLISINNISKIKSNQTIQSTSYSKKRWFQRFHKFFA